MRVFGSLVPTLSRLSLTGVVPVLVLLTVSELIKTNLAIRSPLGVILDPEEDEDDFHSHGHDLGVIHSPISDSFRGSGFESFHSSGLDSISHLDPHIPSQGGCEPIKIGKNPHKISEVERKRICARSECNKYPILGTDSVSGVEFEHEFEM